MLGCLCLSTSTFFWKEASKLQNFSSQNSMRAVLFICQSEHVSFLPFTYKVITLKRADIFAQFSRAVLWLQLEWWASDCPVFSPPPTAKRKQTHPLWKSLSREQNLQLVNNSRQRKIPLCSVRRASSKEIEEEGRSFYGPKPFFHLGSPPPFAFASYFLDGKKRISTSSKSGCDRHEKSCPMFRNACDMGKRGFPHFSIRPESVLTFTFAAHHQHIY